MLPFNGLWSQSVWTNWLVSGFQCMIVKKSDGKFGFQSKSRILPNLNFLAEVFHIRSTFSSCLAVLQISRTSECLMTQRYKKSWIFIFHLYNASQYSVRKIWFFLLEIKVWRLVNLSFNAIKAHLVAIFVFFVKNALLI